MRRLPRPLPVRLLALGGVLGLALAGGACAGAPARGGDELARALRERDIEPAEVVVPFEITPEIREWVRAQVPADRPALDRLQAILDGLTGELELQYEAGYTATAAEAFETRRANCLAFTSLFVGLAREMKVPAFYVDVDDVEKFEKDGDLVVISGHVSAGFDTGRELKILDFSAAPEAGQGYRRVRPISDVTATALHHSNRGAELLRQSLHDEALPWLEKAVAIDPELARGWINYGVALRRAGELDAAERAYRRALELDPSATSVYQNLAALLQVQKRDAEAHELLALTARKGSRNPFNYLALGDLALGHGRAEEARRFYRRALALDRTNADTLASLGQAALAAGDPREARRWLRRAAALDRENPRVRRLAVRLEAEKTAGRRPSG
jgi:Flp pilus assembly protein TadD